MSAQVIDTKLRRSDTPTQVRPDPGAAVYWGEKRGRNDDIRSLACQSQSAQGGRDLNREIRSSGRNRLVGPANPLVESGESSL